MITTQKTERHGTVMYAWQKSKHLKGRSGPRVSHVFDSHIAGWLYGRSGPQVRHVFDSHIAGWL